MKRLRTTADMLGDMLNNALRKDRCKADLDSGFNKLVDPFCDAIPHVTGNGELPPSFVSR